MFLAPASNRKDGRESPSIATIATLLPCLQPLATLDVQLDTVTLFAPRHKAERLSMIARRHEMLDKGLSRFSSIAALKVRENTHFVANGALL